MKKMIVLLAAIALFTACTKKEGDATTNASEKQAAVKEVTHTPTVKEVTHTPTVKEEVTPATDDKTAKGHDCSSHK